MKCKKCGAKLSAEDTVCPGCLHNEKKERFDNILGAVLTLLILILTVFTIFTISRLNSIPAPRLVDESRLQSDPTIYTHGPAVFRLWGDVWNTVIQKDGKQVITTFNYRPDQLESVNNTNLYGDYPYFVSEFLPHKPLYITYDPKDTNSAYLHMAVQELKDNLPVALDKEVALACSDPTKEECQGLTEIHGCMSPESKVYVREAPMTAVLYKKNCVIIQGQGEELIKATERFLFTAYGILPSPRFTDWDSAIPQEFQDV